MRVITLTYVKTVPEWDDMIMELVADSWPNPSLEEAVLWAESLADEIAAAVVDPFVWLMIASLELEFKLTEFEIDFKVSI